MDFEGIQRLQTLTLKKFCSCTILKTNIPQIVSFKHFKISPTFFPITDFSRISDWPNIRNYKLGSVSAVDFDKDKNVVIFHRGNHVWNDRTFNEENNVYNLADEGAIKANTIVTFDRSNGKILDEWGSDMWVVLWFILFGNSDSPQTRFYQKFRDPTVF